jgi:arylsulfatase A-like enzyme
MWCGAIDNSEARSSRAAYLASVAFVDEGLGSVLDAFDARGWLDDTFIVYTADHGDSNGDHYLWRKSYPYESSSRIPLLVRPGATLATQRGLDKLTSVDHDHVTEIRDILPTLLDAVGATDLIPATQPLDGLSLLSLMSAAAQDQQHQQAEGGGGGGASGVADEWRQWLDLEHSQCYSPTNHWSALVSTTAKYIFHAQTGNEQLFDLANDPGELIDLAQDPNHADEVAMWRGRLVAQFVAEGRGTSWVTEAGALVWPRDDILYSPNYPNVSASEMVAEVVGNA